MDKLEELGRQYRSRGQDWGLHQDERRAYEAVADDLAALRDYVLVPREPTQEAERDRRLWAENQRLRGHFKAFSEAVRNTFDEHHHELHCCGITRSRLEAAEALLREGTSEPGGAE